MFIRNRFYLKTIENNGYYYYKLFDWATNEYVSDPIFNLNEAMDLLDSIRINHGEFVYDGVYFFEHVQALINEEE